MRSDKCDKTQKSFLFFYIKCMDNSNNKNSRNYQEGSTYEGKWNS